MAAGLRLPAALQALRATQMRIDNEAPIAAGGSDIAKIMRMSADKLREKYLAIGAATPAELDGYCRFTEQADTWAIYYATVALTAQFGSGG